MTKNAEHISPKNDIPKAKKRFSNRSSLTSKTGAALVAAPSSGEVAAQQTYSSSEQALEVLVDGIVGKLSDDPHGQREMAEFLHTILDTDPALRKEILAGTSIRK